MKKAYTITLKTYKRIKNIFSKEGRSLSNGYIQKEYKIADHSINVALAELIKEGFIEEIQNTTQGRLYRIKDEKKQS